MDFLKALTLALISCTAWAQYHPHQLTAGPSVLVDLDARTPQGGLLLEYAHYLESGFEFFLQAPLALTQTPRSGWVVATGGALGVRYLFAEEAWRPWVDLHVGVTVRLERPEVSWFTGPGTAVGVEWVATESIVLGLRLVYELAIVLNEPVRSRLGGALTVSVLF